MSNVSTPRSRAAAHYALALSHLRHPSKAERRARMANARAALADLFVKAVDPDGRLTERERAYRAALLRSAWSKYLLWCRTGRRKAMRLAEFLKENAPPV